MEILISESEISGELLATSSKSYEQRVLAGALLSKGECHISNFGFSDDVVAARKIIELLGSKSVIVANKLKTFSSNVLNDNIIDCNESAFCARFFAPIACLFKNKFTITGTKTLLKRPVASEFNIFELMGCKLLYDNDKLPVEFLNATLRRGKYIIDGSKTSQLVSGLIMALPTVSGNSQIIIKKPKSVNYIFLTIEVLRKFGIFVDLSVDIENNIVIDIIGDQKYNSGNFEIENDWSGAAFVLVAGALCGNISISGLNKNSIQADRKILEVFELAKVEYFWNEDVLYVCKSDVKAFDFDANDCPDLIPSIVMLSLFAQGKTRIFGAERLIYKESSRGEVLLEELQKIGAKIEILGDMIEITGQNEYFGASLNSHGDHRIAMALAVAGLRIKEGVKIKNSETINKSYPNFFDDLRKLNASISNL
ncbi:3-phosphoshikimate 1-carboxyvinyltransferase [Bacteroidales bacterium OttesenSCG-928-I21]|nr:3-phosphoshikimate 1-carboxyvinyltransferase [Bacteroidales bacterium OttesenSCG-928-I21]